MYWNNNNNFPFCFVGDRYVIETDGLLIKNVDYNDAGTYTCRARVMETGSLEERDIKLEVNILFFCNFTLLKKISNYVQKFWNWINIIFAFFHYFFHFFRFFSSIFSLFLHFGISVRKSQIMSKNSIYRKI